jgi:hypothetical protein
MRFDTELTAGEWAASTPTAVMAQAGACGVGRGFEPDDCTWAVLRTDRRLAAAAAALALLPAPPLVSARLRVEADAGIRLVASRAVSAGAILLEIPFSLCALAPAAAEEAEPLLRDQLLGCGAGGQGARQLRDYFEAMAPLDRAAASDMGCWTAFFPEASARASGAVALQRADEWYAGELDGQRRSSHSADVACGGAGAVGCTCAARADEWLWASLVARRCCRVVRDVGAETSAVDADDEACCKRMLCPIADLAAHDSLAPNAALELHPSGCASSRCAGNGEAGGCVRLVARFAIAAGDPVSVNYDAEADFSDLVERHGLFDLTATVHTAEVIPRGILADALRLPAAAAGGAWRACLIASLAAIGCDAPTGAWWIPDHQPLACPLLGAFRATLVAPAELDAMRRAYPDEPSHALLLRSIKREAEARSMFGSVIRQHLGGYSTSLEQDLADADAGARLGGEAAAAALRFVSYEKQLLHDVLRAL